MAIEKHISERVAMVILRHVDTTWAQTILSELRKIDGGDSFNETIRQLIVDVSRLPEHEEREETER